MPVRNIALIVNTKKGNVVEPSQQHPLTIKAQSGATYSMLNKDTNTFPGDLILKRNGDTLEIEIEQEVVARIEDFYGDKVKATFSVDGTLTPAKGMAITSTNAIAATDEAVNQIIWQPSDTQEEGSNPWFWAAGALGAGSIATAFALSSDDGSSGGNAGSNKPPSGDPGNSGNPSSDYEITVNGAAGPFQSAAIVEIYDTNGNLLTNGNFDAATGQVSLTVSNGYQGPVLVRILDNNGVEGDYLNETSNTMVNLGQPLRAMGSVDGSGDLIISVTPLTELAVRHAGITGNAVSEADLAANDQIANLFGVENLLAPVTTVLGSDYDSSDGFSETEHYGAVLAQFSGADTLTGSLSTTLDQLESEIIDLDSGELALTPEGVELLVNGTDAFATGPNGYIADLTETLIQHPVIEAAMGGINETEKDAGVVIKIPGVYISDKVTLYWGDQSYSFIIDESNFSDGEMASILLPGSTIEAAGDGDIAVYYQINDGEDSPAVLVSVDTSAADTGINNISLSADTGSLDSDFITREPSQTITATLSSGLAEGEILYGSIDGGSSWVDITDTITGGTSISWTGVTLSGSSSIQFTITDAFGNDGDIVSQPYVVDTIAPAISISPIASDGIINAVEDDSDIIITGTSTGVENNQIVTVTLNGVTYTSGIINNEWSITLPAADAQVLAEGQHSITADVSDLAGNAALQATGSVTHASIGPALSIDTVATDGIINAVEDDSDIIITGTSTGVENNQIVTVTLSSITYTGGIINNEWSITLPAADAQALAEGQHIITADVSNLSGNAALQATGSVTHASIVPAVSIDTVATDGIINAVEDDSDIIITGTSTGVENNQIVTVTLNGVNYTGEIINNEWSITLPAADAQALAEGQHTITADVSDLAGNAALQATGSVTHASIVPAVSIDTISTDGIINADEDDSDMIISGTTSNIEDNQVVTVNLNGQTYTSIVTAGTWSVIVPAAEVQGLTEGPNSVTADTADLVGNAAIQATSTITYDTIAPSININTIATDDIINGIEDDGDITISGTGSGVENGQTVTVNLNGQSYTGAVSNDSWNVIVPAANVQSLAEGDHTITADVSDLAGNVADPVTHTVIHDSILPTVNINPIAIDGIINGIEDDSAVIITGFSSGVENGRPVTVSLNSQSYSSTVMNNLWSIIVPAANVQELPEGVNSVTADVSDAAGNAALQAASTVIHNSAAPEISIDVIAEDDMINAIEDNTNVIITGTSTNVENGQIVTVTLDGRNYTGTVTDNVWSISVQDRRVRELEEGSHTVTADVSDIAGNAALQATRSITYDSESPTMSIDIISTDGIINASEDDSDVSITGTSSGVENGRTVTVTLNGQSYTGIVSNDVWSVSLPAAHAQALPEGINNLTADVSDTAGNAASQATGTVTRDSDAPTISLDVIAADDIINAGEDDRNVNITGTSSGVENDLTVTVNLNGQSYTGTVNNNLWSVSLPAADAQTLPEGVNSITADVSDSAGNAAAQATGTVIHDSLAPTIAYTDASYNENILTLTGVNIGTLLSEGESAATDLQDNFDWSRLEWNIEGDDNSTIKFTEADIASVNASDDSTLAVTLESSKADILEATAGFDPLVVDDTITIKEGFSGDTAGNSSVTDAYVSANHVDESIVVFDMVHNASSSHSGRQFDPDTSYSIYILVDGNGLPSGPQPPDQLWSGAENLGEDDNIVLVSHESGDTILGTKNGIVTAHIEYPDSQIWYTGILESSRAFVLHGDGNALRYWSRPAGYDLWHGTVSNMQWGGTGNYTSAPLPAGIMTSQGLA